MPVEMTGQHGRFEMLLDAGENIIQIDSLQQEAYRVNWISANSSAQIRIKSYDAHSNSKDILIINPKNSSSTISITCNKSTFGYLSISCISCEKPQDNRRTPGPIQTQGGFSAEQLIKDFFIAGDCFDVENVSFTGIAGMTGVFSNGNSSINMEEGIAICTGNINQIPGPNSQTGITDDLGLVFNDPDLAEISIDDLFDGAIIEFDFRPKSDIVTFEYVFASDEYCDYVNSDFNDKFGFFLSGPGISGPFTNGAENIAYVPGTTDFVAINSVNIQTNAVYYVDNVPLGQAQDGAFACTVDLTTQGAAVNEIEYDGFTTVLQASSPVIECELYHIKIAIADQGDGAFDSAVFLKKNSFNAGGLSDLSVVYSRPDDLFLYEGCSDGYLEFFRVDPSTIGEDFVISFSISPMSTATPGVDYAPFSTVVTIPAGELSVQIPIEIFNDGILEGLESIILILTNSCRCSEEEIEILINDIEPLALHPINQNFCESTSTIIDVSAMGGLEPLTYNWSTGSNLPSIQVTLSQTDTFYVTVTDDCEAELDTFVIVEIINENSAVFDSEDIEYCRGELIDTTVLINYFGTPPFVMQISLDGIVIDTILVSESNYPLQITAPGLYTISSIQSQDCQITPADDLLVSVIELTSSAEITHIACDSDLLGSVELNVVGDYGPYTFSWSDGFVTMDNEASFLEGIYQVTITDQAGCQLSDTIEILKLTGPDILLDSIKHISCNDDQLGYISIQATGGSGNYSFSWIGMNETTTSIDNLNPGIYRIEVYDEELMCADTAEFEILDTRADVLFELSADTFNCETESGLIQVELMEIGHYEIRWYSILNEEFPSTDSLSLEIIEAGIYIANIVNSITGCSSSDTIEIVSYFFQPSADAPDATIVDCRQSELLLDGSASVVSPNTNIQWSTQGGVIVGDPNEIMVSIFGPGIYILTLTDTLSFCRDLDTVVVSQSLEYPIAKIDLPGILNCKNAELTLSGHQSSIGNNLKYTWSSPTIVIEPTNDALEIVVRDTGLIVLHVQDTVTFCEQFDSIMVHHDFDKPDVVVSSQDTFTCVTQSLVLSGAGSSAGDDINYQWTTSNGLLTGPTDDIDVDVLAPGVYYLMVTDTSNGCSSIDSVVVSPDDGLPIINILPIDTLNCLRTSLFIDASNSSSGPEYQYSWTTTTGQIVGALDSSVIEVTSVGTYILEITDLGNGCKSQGSVTVFSDMEAPLISLSSPELMTCAISQVNLLSTGSSLGAEFDYLWTTQNGVIISSETSPSPIIGASGWYVLEILNTNNGCLIKDSIEVLENYLVPEILNDSLFTRTCLISEITLQIELSDTSLVRYDWQLTDGSVIYDGPSSIVIKEAGSVNVTITSLETGCSNTQEITIVDDINPPIIQLENEMIVTCGPFESIIEASVLSQPPYAINWSTLNGQINSSTTDLEITISSTGTYEVEVVNESNGCRSTKQIEVLNDGTIIAELNIDQPTCEQFEGLVELSPATTGTPPYYYSLNAGPLTEYQGPLSLKPGEYAIEIQDAEGCSDDVVFSIDPPREVLLSIAEIEVLQFGESVVLDPQFNIDESEIEFFEWQPTDYLDDPDLLRPTSTPLEDITYQLTIQDGDGCEAIAIVHIKLDYLINYFVPNVFSPNNDGVNDRVTIFTNHNIKEVRSFQIFNRWGDRVFENYDFPPNDSQYGWDGKFKDMWLDPAVFVFQAELISVFNKSVIIKGDLTLTK